MIDWSSLRAALARCRADNIAVPIWWRDDDAIEQTAALDRLTKLAGELQMPAHIAVIPAHAQASLVPAIIDHPLLHPVVHGWAHKNKAPAGQKKSEFGAGNADAVSDAARGLERMHTLFGRRLLPVFVPPWNRIDPAVTQRLETIGYLALSTYGPRAPSEGITRINTHIDPIFWRGHRGLADPDALIAQTVGLLDARRNGSQDASEAMGYLTHHLVHDEAIWAFSHAFLSELQNGGAHCVSSVIDTTT